MTKSALGKTVFNSGKMFSRLGQPGEMNRTPGEPRKNQSHAKRFHGKAKAVPASAFNSSHSEVLGAVVFWVSLRARETKLLCVGLRTLKVGSARYSTTLTPRLNCAA